MGPRPFSRGRPVYEEPEFRTRVGFNGASTFQSRKGPHSNELTVSSSPLQWGLDLSVEEGRRRWLCRLHLYRLQWGLDLSVEEGSPALDLAAESPELQWGLDLSVEEGHKHRWPVFGSFWASMGPRPFSRGRLVVSHPVLPDNLASMGPRPFSRGRQASDRPIC